MRDNMYKQAYILLYSRHNLTTNHDDDKQTSKHQFIC